MLWSVAKSCYNNKKNVLNSLTIYQVRGQSE